MNTGGDARMKQQLPKTIPESAPCGLKDQSPLQLGSPPSPIVLYASTTWLCPHQRATSVHPAAQIHALLWGVPGAGDTWTNDWFLEVLIYLCELWWSLQTCLPGIHPYTHTLACRQSENPLQTRDPPQAPVLLEYSVSVLPQFSTLNGRGSPKTRTQLSWAIPRGSEIQLPYMDKYFQIGEETPKSDLQSEPRNP